MGGNGRQQRRLFGRAPLWEDLAERIARIFSSPETIQSILRHLSIASTVLGSAAGDDLYYELLALEDDELDDLYDSLGRMMETL